MNFTTKLSVAEDPLVYEAVAVSFKLMVYPTRAKLFELILIAAELVENVKIAESKAPGPPYPTYWRLN